MSNPDSINFAFFGTPALAVEALEEMQALGYQPNLVVSNPDQPVGRKQIITPPPTKVWAKAAGIPVFQPTTLKNPAELLPLTETKFDFFVVLAYGKIMPDWLLKLPTYGTINAHPSLLPKFRGASPIRSTLLYDLTASGVTIIAMDAEIDHGPILKQQAFPLAAPIPGPELDSQLARLSGSLLVDTMKELKSGTSQAIPQDHTKATYSTKITKTMAELAIDPFQLPSGDDAMTLYRQICAYAGWPEAFFIHDGRRIKIKSARLSDQGQLEILRVVPEGKAEIDFTTYLQNHQRTK